MVFFKNYSAYHRILTEIDSQSNQMFLSYQVDLSITDSLTLTLHHTDCPDHKCTATIAQFGASQLSAITYFGGTEQPIEGMVGFVGCLQDMVVNGTDMLLPADLLAHGKASPDLVEGELVKVGVKQ